MFLISILGLQVISLKEESTGNGKEARCGPGKVEFWFCI